MIISIKEAIHNQILLLENENKRFASLGKCLEPWEK